MRTTISTDRLIIPTKLAPPSYRETWVDRPHLLERLAALPVWRLTLITAPAGFGKSTLAARWLYGPLDPQNGSAVTSQAPRPPVAWLTLDEHDQDGLRVLTYLAAAVERAVPGALAATLELLNAPQPTPLYAILEAFLVELDALPAGLTLVLDDYHTLSSEAVHQLMAYLLRHLPRACRLVLISRTDPPLPLARLRAERQLAELRAADLRFTLAETVALLTTLEGAPPDPARAAALHAQTEGWPIALHLAALAGANGRLAEALPGRARRQIAEYLADEVLARQRPELQAALPALAVPERFCAGLAAALLGTPEQPGLGEALIERLEAGNLFVIPLDGEGRWHRFHALFRDLLRRRLRQTGGAGLERTLQQRAAAWLAADGQVEEAVRLFLAAGDGDAAASVMEQVLAPELGRNLRTGPVGHLLRLLPTELIHRRPGLTLLEARLESILLNPSALAACLDRADALLSEPEHSSAPPPWPNFFGDLAVLRGTLRYWQYRPAEAIALTQEALSLEPVPLLFGQALLIMSLAYAADERYHQGVQRIREELVSFRAQRSTRKVVDCHIGLCAMHSLSGSMAELERETIRLAEVGGALPPGLTGYVEGYSGKVDYELSRLKAAASHFRAIVQIKYRVIMPIALGALTSLSMIAAIEGDRAMAEAWQQETWNFAHEFGNRYARHQALALSAWLALRRNDRQAALQYARNIEPDLPVGIYPWFALQPPLLIRARTLITAGNQDDMVEAEALLTRLRAQTESLNNIQPLVGVLTCQALLFQARGDLPAARRSIERAVELAAPRGYLRAFVDFGPSLLPLLEMLAREGIARAYVRSILTAIEAPAAGSSHVAGPAPRLRLPEALSRREREILALLAERWSNREIADHLKITLNTVRKHTSTIYGKLGVSSRREAASVGRALGLLPDEQGSNGETGFSRTPTGARSA